MDAVPGTFRNGKIELLQPVDWPDGTRAEVIPLPQVTSAESTESPYAWPKGYFEHTSGALADDFFERPDQGSLPQREDW